MPHITVWLIVGGMIFCRWVKFFEGGKGPDDLDAFYAALDVLLWIGGGLALFYIVEQRNKVLSAIAEFNKIHEAKEHRDFAIAIREWHDSLLQSDEEVEINCERVA